MLDTAKDCGKRTKATSLASAVADGVYALIPSFGLRLNRMGWWTLRQAGYTRADVRKAIDRLASDEAITVEADDSGVLVVRRRQSEGDNK